MKITMTRHQLKTLVGPVLPFVGGDDGPAALGGVRITAEHGHMVARAASRLNFAMCRRPMQTQDVVDFDILILGHELRDLVKTLQQNESVTLEPNGSTVTAHVHGQGREATLLYRLMETRLFPNIVDPLRAAIVRQAGPTARLSSHQLTMLADVAGPVFNPTEDPLNIHPCDNLASPVLVTCGGHFIALLSPPSPFRPKRPMHWQKHKAVTHDPIQLWTTQLNPEENP